jgi:hypothetical protein
VDVVGILASPPASKEIQIQTALMFNFLPGKNLIKVHKWCWMDGQPLLCVGEMARVEMSDLA